MYQGELLNSNMNFTIPSLSEILLDKSKLAIFLVLLMLILITVAVNALIIFVVIFNRSLRNFINVLYASTAVADIFVGLVAMSCLTVSTLYEYWPLNDSFCLLWCIMDFVCCNVSILNIVSISAYQLRCILKPFDDISAKTRFTIQTFIIATIWLIPFVFWVSSIISVMYLYKYSSDFMDYEQCYFMFTFEYVLVADIIFYISPIIMIVVLQVLIFKALRQKAKRIIPALVVNITRNLQVKKTFQNKITVEDSKTTSHSHTAEAVSISRNTRLGTSLNQNDRKAFSVLVFVSTSSVIMWLPWLVVWPIQAKCKSVPNWVYETSYWMQYLNSLVNPTFLIIRHSSIRKKVLDTIKFKNK